MDRHSRVDGNSKKAGGAPSRIPGPVAAFRKIAPTKPKSRSQEALVSPKRQAAESQNHRDVVDELA